MASTNKTNNIKLSQFIGSDKPDWIGDYNVDMGKIDGAFEDVPTFDDIADKANQSEVDALSGVVTQLEEKVDGMKHPYDFTISPDDWFPAETQDGEKYIFPIPTPEGAKSDTLIFVTYHPDSTDEQIEAEANAMLRRIPYESGEAFAINGDMPTVTLHFKAAAVI